MDTNDARILAHMLMTKHDLFDKGWTFKFNQARRQFGVTMFKPGGFPGYIALSEPLTKLNNLDQVRDTILHEIAHALAGVTENHGPAWQAIAVSIGCDGNRTYDVAEVTQVQGKYYTKCETCGNITQRYRKPKYRKSCGKCHPGVFDERFILTLHTN